MDYSTITFIDQWKPILAGRARVKGIHFGEDTFTEESYLDLPINNGGLLFMNVFCLVDYNISSTLY